VVNNRFATNLGSSVSETTILEQTAMLLRKLALHSDPSAANDRLDLLAKVLTRLR
jgi:hypothetical protein